jgi:hypothetical protein
MTRRLSRLLKFALFGTVLSIEGLGDGVCQISSLAFRRAGRPLSDEHFSVDGTQIAAWASMKSFKAKDGSSEPPGAGRNGERDFHGEKPSNATHASTADPEAQLYRKGRGKEAKLSFMGHALMENRSGLIVAATLKKATGTAERNPRSSL